MRKPSARVGTAAYWIEIFEEQVAREAAKRKPGAALEGPTAPEGGPPSAPAPP